MSLLKFLNPSAMSLPITQYGFAQTSINVMNFSIISNKTELKSATIQDVAKETTTTTTRSRKRKADVAVVSCASACLNTIQYYDPWCARIISRPGSHALFLQFHLQYLQDPDEEVTEMTRKKHYECEVCFPEWITQSRFQFSLFGLSSCSSTTYSGPLQYFVLCSYSDGHTQVSWLSVLYIS